MGIKHRGRAFAHGAVGRRIDPSWGGPIELFLFMGQFEYLLLQKNNKLVHEVYKRDIGDIIGATSMNYNQLLYFINFVQNIHPGVKFT